MKKSDEVRRRRKMMLVTMVYSTKYISYIIYRTNLSRIKKFNFIYELRTSSYAQLLHIITS